MERIDNVSPNFTNGLDLHYQFFPLWN